MQINFKDLIIDDEDRKLFLIDDVVLKAEALRNSILPRLENIFYLIIKEINEIYRIDVLEQSRISNSPNFRKSNRINPITLNYEVCSVALTGKIKIDYWKKLIKKSGEISQHTPFDFQMQLSNEDILCYLVINPDLKLFDNSYQQFDDWTEKNFLKIFPLIQEAHVHYRLYCSDECKPFTSLDNYFIWKKKENILESGFFSEGFSYPLDEKQFEKIKKFFLYLFPIYQTFIDISKGEEIKFENYLNRLQKYYFDKLNEEEQEQAINDTIISNQIDLKEFADQQIKVLPGIRWQVFQRDNWRCIACGRSAEDGIILHVDHIIPRSKGGQNILSNYQTLCNICNIGKSNKDDTNIKIMRE